MRRGWRRRLAEGEPRPLARDGPAISPTAEAPPAEKAAVVEKIMFKIRNLKCASAQYSLSFHYPASARLNLVHIGHGYKLCPSGHNERSDFR
jgi:hypothetical protein